MPRNVSRSGRPNCPLCLRNDKVNSRGSLNWYCARCKKLFRKNPKLVLCPNCGKMRLASLVGKTRICPHCGSDHTQISGAYAKNISPYDHKKFVPKFFKTDYQCVDCGRHFT